MLVYSLVRVVIIVVLVVVDSIDGPPTTIIGASMVSSWEPTNYNFIYTTSASTFIATPTKAHARDQRSV